MNLVCTCYLKYPGPEYSNYSNTNRIHSYIYEAN